MSTFVVAGSAALGLAGGALLSRPVYRLSVPAGEPARDRCHRCGRPLPTGVAGWLRLGPTRCVDCGSAWGPSPVIGGVLGGSVAAALAAMLPATPALAAYVGFAVIGVGLALIDVACRRLPHPVVMSATWAVGAVLLLAAALTGEWNAWWRAVLGAVVLGAVFLVLQLLSGNRLGFGDVKLALPLGLLLGWLGWRYVFFGATLPWLVNAPVVVILLVAKRIDRKSALPFGPAMLAGALLAVVCVAWLDMVGRS